MFICWIKPGFKYLGSILSQLPYVDTEPAIAISRSELFATDLAIFTLALFHSSM